MDVTAVGQRPTPSPLDPAARKDAAAHKAAKDFEATFIAEMLKSSGLNEMPQGFGGGAGEEAFSSFLTQEYAKLMTERGGLGLSQRIYETLKQKATGS